MKRNSIPDVYMLWMAIVPPSESMGRGMLMSVFFSAGV
jgi:hypothetical protein